MLKWMDTADVAAADDNDEDENNIQSRVSY